MHKVELVFAIIGAMNEKPIALNQIAKKLGVSEGKCRSVVRVLRSMGYVGMHGNKRGAGYTFDWEKLIGLRTQPEPEPEAVPVAEAEPEPVEEPEAESKPKRVRKPRAG
jgi:DNA-binding Lrp family transcriptional regulator